MPVGLAIILGLVQALTEFLPISSSGHLVLFQVYFEPLFKAAKTSLAFDVLVHGATLLATLVFLRSELFSLLKHFLSRGEQGRVARKVIALTLVGTIPAGFVGLVFKDEVKLLFSSITVAAQGFIVTTVFLFVAEAVKRMRKSQVEDSNRISFTDWELPTYSQAFAIGLAQMMAIVPGVSRSGATICTCLVLGMSSKSAVRFSFLLSLPAIGGALLLEAENLLTLASEEAGAYGAGFITAFAVGFFAINLVEKITEKSRLVLFGIYTLILGISLLIAG